MRGTFSVEPQNDLKYNNALERRLTIQSSRRSGCYTAAYVGPYTYCWNLSFNNGEEFANDDSGLAYNLQIGNSNSIADGSECIMGKNHEMNEVSLGAMNVCFVESGIKERRYGGNSKYRQKGSIIIQNDVWIGENCTIMGGVTVRNGAVIARESHVVSDVPPYAVVGGNPARVIGYRFSKDIIDKLQVIQWWYWDKNKLIENYEFFNENVEEFCNTFYKAALEEFTCKLSKRKIEDDCYFAFVDYYEDYCSYPHIIEHFLDAFLQCEEKRLVLFVQTDCNVEKIDDGSLMNLYGLIDSINEAEEIKCKIEIRIGNMNDAEETFFECSHFVISRTYNAVYFSCLADRLGMDTLSGVDSIVPFRETYKLVKENDQ